MTNRPLVAIIDNGVMKHTRPPAFTSTAGRRAHPLTWAGGQICTGTGQALWNDPNAARSSFAKTFGCSQAAK